MSAQVHPLPPGDPRSRLDHTLNDVGWGLFLVLMGTLWLLPAGAVPDGTWLLATGVLLLGLNAVRLAKAIPVHWIGAVLGVLALLAGADLLAGLRQPLFPAGLVAAGVVILVHALRKRRA